MKGKEIGLYYRDKAREKAKKKETRVIKLPEHLQEKIGHMLNNSKGYYEKLYNNAYTEDTYGVLENKYVHIRDSQFKRKFINMVSGNMQGNLARALLVKSKLEKDIELDKKLLNEHRTLQLTQEYENMKQFRLKLPSHHKRSKILELIKENQVIVISGETGKFFVFHCWVYINNTIDFI